VNTDARLADLPLNPKHGTHNPTASAPARRPGSVRRTSTIDSLRPDGVFGRVVVDARARDLATSGDGTASVVGERSFTAEIDFTGGRTLSAISASPPDPRLDALIGARVSSGFRGLVAKAVPEQRDAATLLHLLLDDLPTAVLVSGASLGAASRRDPQVLTVLQSSKHSGTPDLCAGWRTGGTLMLHLQREGYAPAVTGPRAPTLDLPADPLAWHDRAALPPHTVRRARRLDVTPVGALLEIDSMFRDSHVDEAGVETVIHEYTVTARVDAASLIVQEAEAVDQVLPWMECPAAAASGARIAGLDVRDLRSVVRTDFVGTSTCTHLNDQLRFLGDVAALAGLVGP
jgi:hypothetical protein